MPSAMRAPTCASPLAIESAGVGPGTVGGSARWPVAAVQPVPPPTSPRHSSESRFDRPWHWRTKVTPRAPRHSSLVRPSPPSSMRARRAASARSSPAAACLSVCRSRWNWSSSSSSRSIAPRRNSARAADLVLLDGDPLADISHTRQARRRDARPLVPGGGAVRDAGGGAASRGHARGDRGQAVRRRPRRQQGRRPPSFSRVQKVTSDQSGEWSDTGEWVACASWISTSGVVKM